MVFRFSANKLPFNLNIKNALSHIGLWMTLYRPIRLSCYVIVLYFSTAVEVLSPGYGVIWVSCSTQHLQLFVSTLIMWHNLVTWQILKSVASKKFDCLPFFCTKFLKMSLSSAWRSVVRIVKKVQDKAYNYPKLPVFPLVKEQYVWSSHVIYLKVAQF